MTDAEPTADELPAYGRLAGVDYGTVRIGLAVCDPDRRLASPYEIYARRSIDADADYFRRFVRDERIVGFVVGLPIHSNGQESRKSSEARAFGRWLRQITGRPVRFYDERYTSAQAEQFLLGAGLTRKRRKLRLDKVAAQLILAAYLESNASADPGALW